jgi:hypothetical protein
MQQRLEGSTERRRCHPWECFPWPQHSWCMNVKGTADCWATGNFRLTRRKASKFACQCSVLWQDCACEDNILTRSSIAISVSCGSASGRNYPLLMPTFVEQNVLLCSCLCMVTWNTHLNIEEGAGVLFYLKLKKKTGSVKKSSMNERRYTTERVHSTLPWCLQFEAFPHNLSSLSPPPPPPQIDISSLYAC